MNILLINPSKKKLYGKLASPDYPPLSLGYIAAVLEREKHNVKIIDIDADKITRDSFIKILKSFRPKLVGITTTTPTYKNSVKLAKIVKEYTNAKTVLGGIHATIAPDDTIKSDVIDFLIKGEGEVTITELAKALQNEKKDFSNIKGLFYKKNDKVIKNKPRELIKNLDELPFPARHLFNQTKYTYPDATETPTMPIITSRGCPGQCTYCCTKLIFTMKFRYRSAKNIVDEIEHLIEKFDVKEFHIWDDNATLIKKRIVEIRDELKGRRIKTRFAFPNGIRVDYFDEEIAQLLKEMGAYSLAFGVESGNQEVLNNVKKGTTLAQIRKAFKIAKSYGFETWAFFMIGLKGDTKDTVRDTINLAKELDPDIAKFHILVPFPGTEIYYDLLSKGYILNKDYSKYGIHTRPVHKLSGLTPDDMVNLQKQAYREFYLRPRIILKQILRIRSFNRLKLNIRAGISIIKSMF